MIPHLALLLQLAAPVLAPATAGTRATTTPRAGSANPARTLPRLAFPETGLDDPAAYQGYQTRLFRDGALNTVQLYIDQRAARVVHVWADAENESIGFTARTGTAAVVPLRWDGVGATTTGGLTDRRRTLEHRLIADAPLIHLGWFLLGTMRVERDFQYEERQRQPFANQSYQLPELDRMLSGLGRLDSATRGTQLALLHAPDVATLQARRRPTVTVSASAGSWIARVVQSSLDGRDTLTLELQVDPSKVEAGRAGDSVSFRARAGNQVPFTVRVSTTGAPLHPLSRQEIFTPSFLQFLANAKAGAKDSASPSGIRARRLERQVRGVELLASREKLMAGLPTYATYFGRDMLVSALMMRNIWRSTMSEAVIAAALRKLSPTGEVSHEEALGGQAVREAASEYATLLDARETALTAGNRPSADSLLRRATTVLTNARETRENYHMIDDEFQLPVFVARWITDPSISAAQKRAFLKADGGHGVSRAVLLARELGLVARMTAAYSARPDATNLVSFAPREPTGWSSASWRDSGAGYAGGRYAMDVNAIWAPQALESIARIGAALNALGMPLATSIKGDALLTANAGARALLLDSLTLHRAIGTWRDASRHFLVQLSAAQVQAGVSSRLAAMPPEERTHWAARVSETRSDRDSLTFLALALDANARPIAVANTDPATRLFLGEHEGAAPSTTAGDVATTLRDVRLFVRPYPVGLAVDGIGPVVANDAYSTPAIWESFAKDPYHGPRVIWGREVNLFLLGAASHMPTAPAQRDPVQAQYARELRGAIDAVRSAVNASGFHSELWSYGFTNGKISPMRYGSGADVQLWSTTDLAVEFALDRLPKMR